MPQVGQLYLFSNYYILSLNFIKRALRESARCNSNTCYNLVCCFIVSMGWWGIGRGGEVGRVPNLLFFAPFTLKTFLMLPCPKTIVYTILSFLSFIINFISSIIEYIIRWDLISIFSYFANFCAAPVTPTSIVRILAPVILASLISPSLTFPMLAETILRSTSGNSLRILYIYSSSVSLVPKSWVLSMMLIYSSGPWSSTIDLQNCLCSLSLFCTISMSSSLSST